MDDQVHISYEDETQPYPGGLARTRAAALEDPRLGCWFCGEEATALAPRHSGGDDDVPAHWLPVCEHHEAHWHNQAGAGERLPIIPRNGVALTVEQARALHAELRYDADNGNIEDEVALEAYEAIETGLRALNDETGDTP